jgi:hypothetical protein
VKKHSLFHEKQKIGEIGHDGYVENIENPENAEKIMPILDNLPAFLNNAIPEGERYENLLLASPEKNDIGIAANLDELPGNISLDEPESRRSLPFPKMNGNTLFAETLLPSAAFWANSSIRLTNKPSFSGYQDKFTAMAVEQEGKIIVRSTDPQKEIGNILIKPGIRIPFTGENEFFCMRMAKKIGLDVPEVFLIQNPDRALPASHFCVERFDISYENGTVRKRLVSEFATLMGLKSDEKYSARTEALFQRAEEILSPKDLRAMGLAYMYGILTGNGDMHTKNFSVFFEEEQYRLTPIYDMLNTKVHGFPEKLALPLYEKYNSNPRTDDIVKFLERYITKKDIADMLEILEANISPLLDFTFTPVCGLGNFREQKRQEFRYTLENAIMENAAEVHEAIGSIKPKFFLRGKTAREKMLEDSRWIEAIKKAEEENKGQTDGLEAGEH